MRSCRRGLDVPGGKVAAFTGNIGNDDPCLNESSKVDDEQDHNNKDRENETELNEGDPLVFCLNILENIVFLPLSSIPLIKELVAIGRLCLNNICPIR